MRVVLLCVLFTVNSYNALADTRCFDQQRFCFATERDDDRYTLTLYRHAPLPVVVTVYAPQLASHHATYALVDDTPVTLATLDNPAAFWRTMRVRWTPGELNATHNDDIRYSPPLKPIDAYPIVQGYDGQFSHTGDSRYALDFAADVGTPVYAARGGVVIDVKADSNSGGASQRYAGDANYIAILHDDGTTGEYYHLKHQGVRVSRGEQVARGAHIGDTGNTGFSSLPHLHFAVYRAKSHGRFESVRVRFSPPLIDTSTH
ncbi:M23 family metallopeptidase [Alteromonas halophila]|uniref:M23ase beta-sheet core domain-containing protein n=1 Tax=Alteromonas halophila TaxID=516698 RepID=A0A918N0Q9_9ALTE|nr:M23 family metallopeptidase [Alteromonas halophila]GGW90516.1 hypothetical protein GCM10007391_25930 [Alteromonas halophila]